MTKRKIGAPARPRKRAYLTDGWFARIALAIREANFAECASGFVGVAA